jgi:cytochrome c556
MLTHKKSLLAISLITLTTANFLIASDAVSSNAVNPNAISSGEVSSDIVKVKATEGSLKLVMQGLLKDTQELTAAMLNEDFALIATKAENIADHPKPSMVTRMKVMKAMGSDMAQFKANDGVVHKAALAIMTNAQQKNIDGVGENFKKMIGGCLSCHGQFKNSVSALFK